MSTKLGKLLPTLRKFGVTSYVCPEFSVQLGPAPEPTPARAATAKPKDGEKSDEEPKLPALPKDAATLALHLGGKR